MDSKFMVITDDDAVDSRYVTLDEAINAARRIAADTPDIEVEVAEIVKVALATLSIEVKDA